MDGLSSPDIPSLTDQPSSLLAFAALVIAFVVWLIVVIVIFPRLLGRLFSFSINRAAHNAYHVSIPSLHIYPLAGRLVAHAVRYTTADLCLAVEELVFQCRWWRRHQKRQDSQVLNVDPPETFNTVAQAQQQAYRENSAVFIKRLWYRLRRWWRRTAVVRDQHDPSEPPPLISLILVGLRVRVVNNQRNYSHVRRVLTVARSAARRRSNTTTHEAFDLSLQDLPIDDSEAMPQPDVTLPTSTDSPSSSSLPSPSTSSYSSVRSVDEKPFSQRVLEHISLRISDGSFFVCDMGQSPLLRLTVDAAKLRYRYGAPACAADICRKRIRIGISSISLSVSSRAAVRAIVAPTEDPSVTDDNRMGTGDCPDTLEMADKTDRLIERVVSMGYRGVNASGDDLGAVTQAEMAQPCRSRRATIIGRFPSLPVRSRQKIREGRRTHALPCVHVLYAATSIIEYVFDEPGSIHDSSVKPSLPPNPSILTSPPSNKPVDAESLSPPACRVSVLLRDCVLRYDVGAIADIERVIERLQPVFYDLLPFVKMLQQEDGKRSATGMQIDIDATPKSVHGSDASGRLDTSDPPAILTLPFIPRLTSWMGLIETKTREWRLSPSLHKSVNSPPSTEGAVLPPSHLDVHSSSISLRTEIPFENGAEQKMVVSVKDARIASKGVVDMPFINCKELLVTRVVHYPDRWNDEHVVSTDVDIVRGEIVYQPDIMRIISDISATMTTMGRKAPAVNYFVPYRQTTKIRATDSYSLLLSCSRDNAWKDIYRGEADEYGQMKLCGKRAELVLSPNAPSEFQPNSSAISWSLSLPDVVVRIEFLLTRMQVAKETTEDAAVPASSRVSHYWVRPPSLPRRTKSSVEVTASLQEHSSRKNVSVDAIEVDIMRCDGVCKLSGKSISHEDEKYLSTPIPAFLDSINTSDITFQAQDLTMDLNPHHITHLLNVLRNYIGPGAHTISLVERLSIDARRHRVASAIMQESRHPNLRECIILGLAQAYTLPSVYCRPGVDDVSRFSLLVENLLIRLYDLPHMSTPFSHFARNTCSIVSDKLSGEIVGNRLGSMMDISASSEKGDLFLYGGHISSKRELRTAGSIFNYEKLLPSTRVDGFKIRKVSHARELWSTYFSSLRISMESVKGCLLDISLAALCWMGPSFLPDALSEDIGVVASLLSVDTVDVDVKSFDVLVLSTSSASSQGTDSSVKTHLPRRKENHRIRGEERRLLIPQMLAGVTNVQMNTGFRVVLSTLAFERDGFLSRFLFPSFTLDVLVPSGGKFTPWVDEGTLRAQVSHSSLPRRGLSSYGLLSQSGVLVQAAQISETTVDMTYASRPSLWSAAIPRKQTEHVLKQSEHNLKHLLPWCERGTFVRGDTLADDEEADDDHILNWWNFLYRSSMAHAISKHRRSSQCGARMDVFSSRLTVNTLIVLSPECLSLVREIVIRSKELDESSELIGKQGSIDSYFFKRDTLCLDIVNLWSDFEKAKHPSWLTRKGFSSGSFVKAFDTNGVKLVFRSPFSSTDSHEGDSLSAPISNEEEIFIFLPDGLHLLNDHVLHSKHAIPVERKHPGRALPDVSRTNTLHISIPSVLVGYLDSATTRIMDIILISHERNAVSLTTDDDRDLEEVKRRDRATYVAKVGSIKVGESRGTLKLYACFGRVGCILLLLSRILVLETSAYFLKKRQRLAKLCETVLSGTVADVLQKDPDFARTFFVSALKVIQTSHTELSWNDVVSASDYTFPNVALVPNRRKIPIQSSVQSIDITLRDISLVISRQEIVRSDFFLVKGGKTISEDSSSDLDGYVLNASFGTVSLSLRDDIAADTLGMVSSVASYVRRATFSMPMLRHENHGPDKNMRLEHTGISFSSTMDDLNNRSSSFADRGFDSHFRNSFSGGLSSSAGMLSPSRTSLLGSLQSGTNRFRDLYRRSTISVTRGVNSLERNVPVLRVRNEPKFSLAPSHRPLSAPHHSGSANNPNSVTFSSPHSSLAHVPAVHFEDLPSVQNTTSAGANASTTTMDRFSDESVFTHMAVRTAGDGGPPRKRSKRMVPLIPVVPPAFENIDSTGQMRSGYMHSSYKTANSWVYTSPGVSETNMERQATEMKSINSTNKSSNLLSLDHAPSTAQESSILGQLNVTLFVSCREIVSRYYRGGVVHPSFRGSSGNVSCADISFTVHAPRLTLMSQPEQNAYSIVVTASSAKLLSSNNPRCTLSGSIARIGVTVSIAEAHVPSKLPKFITSARVSDFTTTLQATDLQSVLKFREEFKKDLVGLLSAFLTTKHSIFEMARAARLSPSRTPSPTSRSIFSTMAFDVLFERSEVKLAGFHPKDSNMSMSYVLDGVFFSVAASEDDNAALTLGLRLYGHGLLLSSPSWPEEEHFSLPSLDARGVQWAEASGLPTILKVTTEPLVSLTSFQGLRHVLFTVAGLLAFQKTNYPEEVFESCLSLPNFSTLNADANSRTPPLAHNTEDQPQYTAGSTPFTRSFAAWERTKGVRMDLSIRPLSLSLASGQVVALFEVESVSGVFEWNKLVVSGVQLHTAVNIPRVSLSFMRMPTTDFLAIDVKPDERRTSLSVMLEKTRVDLVKSQNELTHQFIFRTNIFTVSGQVRPWRLLLDAAVWADEQEFVSDLQSINYSSLSASRNRSRAYPVSDDLPQTEHRLVLFGANIQRVMLAVPLLNSEQPSNTRLAVRAMDLHVFVRHRFDHNSVPSRNIFQIKSHFIGILWENSSLLSSHHAQIIVGVKASSRASLSHFGTLNVVVTPGTWRICPRRDVIVAILDAKNRKDNRMTDRTQEMQSTISGVLTGIGSSVGADSLSNVTEKESRLLMENLSLQIVRTSGFIEGLEHESSNASPGRNENVHAQKETAEKVSVPAFSISAVRIPEYDFDLFDIDFSGKEGEFPRGCLQKITNLFSDLFGAVASDQQWAQKQGSIGTTGNAPQQSPRDASRNVSVLIRFGRSLYRAQEEAKPYMDSKIGLFAGRSSALLVSLTTAPIIHDDCSRTTVITGVSPKLALEITPLLGGAEAQSLRLVDARFLHGLCPCHDPHTVVHINRVTALTEAKTLLLTAHRLGQVGVVKSTSSTVDGKETPHKLSGKNTGRNLVFVLGKSRTSQKSVESPSDGTARGEADIRLQLKLNTKGKDIGGNQMDLIVDRVHLGVNRWCINVNNGTMCTSMHCAVHDMMLRGRWDILSCKLRLRENLLRLDTMDGPWDTGTSPNNGAMLANIINRMFIENLQYGKHTLKLDVDALAAMVRAPSRIVTIESTTVHGEVSHTLSKAIAKLAGQWKKLRNEVKLLMEKEPNGKSKISGTRRRSVEDISGDKTSGGWSGRLEALDITDGGSSGSTSSGGVSLSGGPFLQRRQLLGVGDQTELHIKGDALTLLMRGYQFEETRHSAMISLMEYGIDHKYDFDGHNGGSVRRLDADFGEMVMSYNDDERQLRSELFKVLRPQLRLTMREGAGGLRVGLVGDLEVKLGHGFYNWQEFRELLELTVSGIAPAPPRDSVETEVATTVSDVDTEDGRNSWDGDEKCVVEVKLNPRIDVIGDLTADVLPMMSARLKKQVDGIPRHMYDYLVLPLESLSKTVCDPLFR